VASQLLWALNGQTTTPPPGWDRIECKTYSCSKWDNWTAVNFTNSTEICQMVQDEAMAGFAAKAPGYCRSWKNNGLGAWKNCRQEYCKMYADIQTNLSHLGGPGFYGGDECRPLLNFNETLCLTDYRDSAGFCDCICPAMDILEPEKGGYSCEAEIMSFLLLGRRGYELAKRVNLNGFCARLLCDWFAKI
ncbi:unnamed protein product, partial [Polarella glacialis]